MTVCVPATKTPTAKAYTLRTIACTVPYVAICVAMMTTNLFDGMMGQPIAWLLAFVVAAPIAGQIWALLIFMRDSDEFVRAVTAKQVIIASGIALSIAAFWGFAENFASAPHIESWLIVPVFYAAFGLVSPFVRSTNG